MMATRVQNPTSRLSQVSGQVYRFHSQKYFEIYPPHFYKNFIETRSKFAAQERFAGANSHCGFYFAGSAQVATAEALFYLGSDDDDISNISPRQILERYAKASSDRLFLTTDLTIDRLLDFTDWQSVEEALRFGSLKWKGRRLEYQVQYLTMLLSNEVGGSELTDVLGMDAKSLDCNGVLFPSVRALTFAAPNPRNVMIRQRLEDLQRMTSAANIMELPWQAVEQMKAEYNLVIFSGVELIRSIRSLSWLKADGETGTLENPYFGATNEAIELARLRERANRGLDPVAAAEEGLLTETEMEDEFHSTVLFIRNA